MRPVKFDNLTVLTAIVEYLNRGNTGVKVSFIAHKHHMTIKTLERKVKAFKSHELIIM